MIDMITDCFKPGPKHSPSTRPILRHFQQKRLVGRPGKRPVEAVTEVTVPVPMVPLNNRVYFQTVVAID